MKNNIYFWVVLKMYLLVHLKKPFGKKNHLGAYPTYECYQAQVGVTCRSSDRHIANTVLMTASLWRSGQELRVMGTGSWKHPEQTRRRRRKLPLRRLHWRAKVQQCLPYDFHKCFSEHHKPYDVVAYTWHISTQEAKARVSKSEASMSYIGSLRTVWDREWDSVSKTTKPARLICYPCRGSDTYMCRQTYTFT